MRVISLWLLVVALQLAHAYQVKDDLSLPKTLERLKPEGHLKVNGKSDDQPTAQALIQPGQAVVQKYCNVCHSQGIAGAPKIGDKAAWSARMAQGIQQIVHHAIVGYKGMPAKGHCTKCSDKEIQEAVEFMLKKSEVPY